MKYYRAYAWFTVAFAMLAIFDGATSSGFAAILGGGLWGISGAIILVLTDKINEKI